MALSLDAQALAPEQAPLGQDVGGLLGRVAGRVVEPHADVLHHAAVADEELVDLADYRGHREVGGRHDEHLVDPVADLVVAGQVEHVLLVEDQEGVEAASR